LLTEVMMPGMGGRELVDRLMPLRPEMNVLYMSGYADDAIIHHGVLEGAAFLQKPFTFNDLTQKEREVLGEKNRMANLSNPLIKALSTANSPNLSGSQPTAVCNIA
jgi:FixJ family two-component response regulator